MRKRVLGYILGGLTALIVALIAFWVIAACGGGNESPTLPPLAVPTSTPTPTASVVEVAVDNSTLTELSITGTMLPPRIDDDGWPWVRILLGGGVYEFPAPDTADGERLYIVAKALAFEEANVEVIVSTQFVAALQLASDNGNEWIWSPEGGGLSEFGWEIYNAYMALEPTQAPTPSPTSTPYVGYSCDGEWTRIITDRAWLAYDGGSADSRIVVGQAQSRKGEEVIEFTWATWAQSPEALVTEYNNLLGWDVQALFSCTDSPLGTPYLQKLYVGGDRQQEVWTTEPLAWPEGVTIDELNLTGEATSFVDVPLQVTVLEKHPRIIDPSGIWPQVEAPADTLEAVSLGVVEGSAYSKGSCPGPEMEVGIVNDGFLVDDTILCMGPNQWVEVEFSKTDFLTMVSTTGRFLWAPGNGEGNRSMVTPPPTDPIGTYFFNGDTHEFGLRLAGQ